MGLGEYVALPQGRFVEGIVRLHTEQVILFYRTITQFKCRYHVLRRQNGPGLAFHGSRMAELGNVRVTSHIEGKLLAATSAARESRAPFEWWVAGIGRPE